MQNILVQPHFSVMRLREETHHLHMQSFELQQNRYENVIIFTKCCSFCLLVGLKGALYQNQCPRKSTCINSSFSLCSENSLPC